MGFFKATPKPPPKSSVEDEDPVVARRRVEEEFVRIQNETNQKRKIMAKTLIGEEAESVGGRKQGVAIALEEFQKKGTDTVVHVEVEAPIQERKQAYAQDLQRFSNKGKSEPALAASLPQDLTAKFDDPNAPKPTLFQADPLMAPKSPTKNNKVTANNAPKASSSAAAAAALQALRPQGWDGKTYYSLVDLRQRRVQGIDMKNREQYLSPEEFQLTFGMTKEEFALCPKWKRDKLKYSIHLF